MSAENKALVRRWFEEVWNNGQVAAIDEMLAPDATVHGLGPDLVGPAGFKPFQARFRNAFPDLRIQVEDLVAEGSMVAARWSVAGTHHGDALGFGATGRRAQMTGMTFIRVENGRLAEGWNIFDQLGMLQQLGVTNVPAA